MKSETTSLQLEIGKKYRVRNDRVVEYVKITKKADNLSKYDFTGDLLYKDGRIVLNIPYMSTGSFLASGKEDAWDCVEEYTSEEVGAAKNDKKDCKADISLISYELMKGCSYAMMAGELKYERHNYKKGHKLTQLINAAIRHLKEYEGGNNIDDDCTDRLRDGCVSVVTGKFNSGYGEAAPDVSHLDCAIANLNMIKEQILLKTLIDDRG